MRNTTLSYQDRLIRLAAKAYEAYDHADFWPSLRLLARFNKINRHLTWETGEVGNRKSLSTFAREGHPLAKINYRTTPLVVNPAPTMQTLTNPAPTTKQFPFRRYAAQGIKVRVLRHIGKVAIGHVEYAEGLPIAAYVGRWRNRYAQHTYLPGLLAILKAYRAEHKAKEAERIGLYDVLGQCLIEPACLRLLCITLRLNTAKIYTRQELRRTLLANRGPHTKRHLAMLANIVIEPTPNY